MPLQLWGVFAGSIISICGLHAVKNSYPANMALLFVFTLLESYIVGVICCMYKTESVIIAAVLTTGVTVSLSVYALTAKTDFSSWGASLYAALWCLIIGSLVQIFFPYSSMLSGLVSVFGAILFSFFIIYDTDQIANRMSPDDYDLYHKFEKNLLPAEGTNTPCADHGYPRYKKTLTHGAGPIKMTFDMYTITQDKN